MALRLQMENVASEFSSLMVDMGAGWSKSTCDMFGWAAGRTGSCAGWVCAVRDPAAYLAGLIDADGCVFALSVREDGTYRGGTRHVQFCNTDPALIQAAEACCRDLDLPFTLGIKSRQRGPAMRTLFITGRENLERFRELVPLRSPAKRQKLDELLASYGPSPATLAVHQRRREQADRARALKQSGATLEQIGADLGISMSTASRRLAT